MFLLIVRQDKSEIIKISALIYATEKTKNGIIFKRSVFVKVDFLETKIKFVFLSNVLLDLRETGMVHV